MIAEGERIKALVAGAIREVILCSPFIKAKVFEAILSVIPRKISVRVVTRWRPPEVAAGLSDLEVFDIATERENTQVDLLHSLHAKLYVADNRCLVGSANLTAAALGWRPDSNLEVLISADRSDSDVSLLLDRLRGATPATFQIRADIEKQASLLDQPELNESQDMSSAMTEKASQAWLPRCAAPDKLYEAYRDPDTKIITVDTRMNASEDLEDLGPMSDLSEKDFVVYIQSALSQMPSIQMILAKIPAGMTDAQGEQVVSLIRNDLAPSDVQKQWSIIRDWISVFFHDKYEVAPRNFVVRLKPH